MVNCLVFKIKNHELWDNKHGEVANKDSHCRIQIPPRYLSQYLHYEGSGICLRHGFLPKCPHSKLNEYDSHSLELKEI